MAANDGNSSNGCDSIERSELQMAPELMLEVARQTAELLVERIERLPEEGAWDGDFQRELEDRLLEDPPEEGRAPAAVIERVAREVLPFATRLDHPRCFAFIPSAPTWPGVLADFVAAACNFNVCTWLVASGPSQLELVVIDWIRRWIGYPESAGGLLTSGGSAASLDAFVAAREAAGNLERPTVYMSDQSHSAQIRAAKIIGVRPECIRMIPIDESFRLDMEALVRAVGEDRAEGFNPIAVCANAGAVSNGAIDPLEDMADFAKRKVDGCTPTPRTVASRWSPRRAGSSCKESSVPIQSVWMGTSGSSNPMRRAACW